MHILTVTNMWPSAARPFWGVFVKSQVDSLVAAGITSILNFAPTVLAVPEGVDVRKVDLSIELQILAYHVQRKAATIATTVGATPLAGKGVS